MKLVDDDFLAKHLLIPSELAFFTDINDSYKFIYGHLCNISGVKGYTSSTNAEIARLINKNSSSIAKALKALEETNWICINSDVKRGMLYDDDYKRVIWIDERYVRTFIKEKGK